MPVTTRDINVPIKPVAKCSLAFLSDTCRLRVFPYRISPASDLTGRFISRTLMWLQTELDAGLRKVIVLKIHLSGVRIGEQGFS